MLTLCRILIEEIFFFFHGFKDFDHGSLDEEKNIMHVNTICFCNSILPNKHPIFLQSVKTLRLIEMYENDNHALKPDNFNIILTDLIPDLD